MSFRLSNEVRKYFKKIDANSKTGKFKNMWDYYYLCLMVGFRNEELGEEISESSEFNKDFPRSYYSNRYQIIAALILAEIRRQGIMKNDSDKIRKLMLELLDTDAVTKISNTGLKRMNRYAEKGFRLINEKIPEPVEMDEFIKKYYEEFIEIDC